MVGLELVAGYLMAWAVRKARRVGQELDQDADLVLDAGLDRLHNLVVAKLGSDPALARLEQEVTDGGEVSERTRRRVVDAVAEAAESDEEFSASLRDLLASLEHAAGGEGAGIIAGTRAAVVTGDAEVTAKDGSAAALTMGDVTLGATDPSKPGRGSA
ncbi:hypothetical protein KDK95_19740 [Actinospica sp. MGRD01-02]|uniref:Chromosome partitioning protein n=1 Tax=Actinospica acidithermotolerans TaxID=2828514 RepID=A0A941IIP3_9ACTN|nr:hypothetical protein [Actinospica acidithermotolerans]MBR7828554.1 hypothetical protein [Actinospica acidithermotolerans]